jgi:hypothetical protein
MLEDDKAVQPASDTAAIIILARTRISQGGGYIKEKRPTKGLCRGDFVSCFGAWKSRSSECSRTNVLFSHW